MKLLFFSGSARKNSLNKRLAKCAYQMALDEDQEATFIDLADFEMPIYNGDLEEQSGLPDSAKKLKQIFVEHQGIFIASPEYNSSYSGLLKNTIDWISRPETKDEPRLQAFQNKVVAIAAASPGGLGGLRGLVTLRMLMGNLGAVVIPNQLAVGGAQNKLNEAAEVTDEATQNSLKAIVDKLILTTNDLNR